MRNYKQVKEKKVTFDMSEWAEVESSAAAVGMKTGTNIKKIVVNGGAQAAECRKNAQEENVILMSSHAAYNVQRKGQRNAA